MPAANLGRDFTANGLMTPFGIGMASLEDFQDQASKAMDVWGLTETWVLAENAIWAGDRVPLEQEEQEWVNS